MRRRYQEIVESLLKYAEEHPEAHIRYYSGPSPDAIRESRKSDWTWYLMNVAAFILVMVLLGVGVYQTIAGV